MKSKYDILWFECSNELVGKNNLNIFRKIEENELPKQIKEWLTNWKHDLCYADNWQEKTNKKSII